MSSRGQTAGVSSLAQILPLRMDANLCSKISGVRRNPPHAAGSTAASTVAACSRAQSQESSDRGFLAGSNPVRHERFLGEATLNPSEHGRRLHPMSCSRQHAVFETETEKLEFDKVSRTFRVLVLEGALQERNMFWTLLVLLTSYDSSISDGTSCVQF